MRELTGHRVNGCNEVLRITVEDEPGHGNACHRYKITQDGTKAVGGGPAAPGFCYAIDFQNGPIATVGVNGLTHEALLAILIDRLEGFQAGQYACEENAEALNDLKHAQGMLKFRTEKRLARGVEGTHAK